MRWEEYTSFNKIAQMRFGLLTNPANPTDAVADRTVQFVYGPEHQRLRQSVTLTSNAPSHMEAGDTWYMNGPDSLGLAYEKHIKPSGLIEHKHYLSAGGVQFAMHTQRAGPLGGLPAKAVSYFHHDHLGSLSVITNAQGAVTERLAYDAWGKRRHVDGQRDTLEVLTAQSTQRGYTMHEHMDQMGVINMNGRVYDPLIGRFLSADPHIQAPEDLQSFNRYAYVKNNPLAFTDPTGYFWKKIKKYLKQIVAVVVAVVIVIYAPILLSNIGLGTFTTTAMGSSVATGLTFGGKIIAGALGGGLSSAISAGSGKAFWQGAFTGALFGWAGAATGGPGTSALAKVGAHAAAGCASAVAGGGKCGHGAAAAAFGKFVTVHTDGLFSDTFAGHVAQGTVATVSGGVSSMLAGGEFKDGARTAAFGYMFNRVLSKEEAEANANARNRAVMSGHCVSGGPLARCSGVSDFSFTEKQTAEQRQTFRTISGQVADNASTGLAMAAPWAGPVAPAVAGGSVLLKGYATWATPPTLYQAVYDTVVAPLPVFTQTRPLLDTALTFGAAAMRPK